jgi:hypothetical protein
VAGPSGVATHAVHSKTPRFAGELGAPLAMAPPFAASNDRGPFNGETCEKEAEGGRAARGGIHEEARVRAAKEDGAEIPFFLWDDRLAVLLGFDTSEAFPSSVRRGLEGLRTLAHAWWVRSVRRLWWRYWREQ